MDVVEMVRPPLVGGPTSSPPGGGADDARTRTRVRSAVAEFGPVHATRIAGLLGLTVAAVRRHLDAMVAEGVLELREPSPGQRRGRGRPAKEYVVGSAGHDALPAGYDDLALSALAYLAEVQGPAAVEDFAQRRFAALEQSLAGLQGSPAERVQALVAALAAQGYSASARPAGRGTAMEGLQLCQGHCPVQRVAEAFPQLCEAERRTFERVLGTRVQRLATLAHGDHVCTSFIPLDQLAPHHPDDQPHPHDRTVAPATGDHTPTEGRRL
ncbi:helix-turn-helix transcriptional regulator [Kineococcus radiotolerans]|uniref:helix-turn-helix transcriptional regulator n=1 Tax=Kineococcus radiotolerans TaxID=131568 RepID=UPI001C85579B